MNTHTTDISKDRDSYWMNYRKIAIRLRHIWSTFAGNAHPLYGDCCLQVGHMSGHAKHCQTSAQHQNWQMLQPMSHTRWKKRTHVGYISSKGQAHVCKWPYACGANGGLICVLHLFQRKLLNTLTRRLANHVIDTIGALFKTQQTTTNYFPQSDHGV